MNNTNAPTGEAKHGSPPMKQSEQCEPAMPALKPWDIAELPLFRFTSGQVVNVEQASDEQFEAWTRQQGIPVENRANVAGWTFDNRCKLINHCRFYGVWDALHFPIDVGAVGEKSAVALTDERAAPTPTEDAQTSAEDAGFLRDVERAKAVVSANPEINAQALADALGLKSAAYAHTLKVYLHAHKSTEDRQPEEGTEACYHD